MNHETKNDGSEANNIDIPMPELTADQQAAYLSAARQFWGSEQAGLSVDGPFPGDSSENNNGSNQLRVAGTTLSGMAVFLDVDPEGGHTDSPTSFRIHVGHVDSPYEVGFTGTVQGSAATRTSRFRNGRFDGGRAIDTRKAAEDDYIVSVRPGDEGSAGVAILEHPDDRSEIIFPVGRDGQPFIAEDTRESVSRLHTAWERLGRMAVPEPVLVQPSAQRTAADGLDPSLPPGAHTFSVDWGNLRGEK